MKIRYVHGAPPFWRILKFFFPEYNPEGTVSVAFGRTIYANDVLPEDYDIHEMTHLRQQSHSYVMATIWWIRYIASRKFRYSQELEAYQEQYRWLFHRNSSIKRSRLHRFAKELSGKLYGNLVSESEAMNKILSVVWKKK